MVNLNICVARYQFQLIQQWYVVCHDFDMGNKLSFPFSLSPMPTLSFHRISIIFFIHSYIHTLSSLFFHRFHFILLNTLVTITNKHTTDGPNGRQRHTPSHMIKMKTKKNEKRTKLYILVERFFCCITNRSTGSGPLVSNSYVVLWYICVFAYCLCYELRICILTEWNQDHNLFFVLDYL